MRAAGWRERGVTSVEYAIMAAIIVVLLVAGVAALGGRLALLGLGSARHSPARWRWGRRCSCSTSRPKDWPR